MRIIPIECIRDGSFLGKDTFSNIGRFNSINNTADTNFKASKKDSQYFEEIMSVSEELLQNILNNKNISVNLVDIKSMDNYTYQHSVNVAILSLIMGIGLKLSKRDLINLCIGALVHDIGKVFISKEILNKEGRLTYDEYELMKDHPKRGYYYLSQHYELNSACKIITNAGSMFDYEIVIIFTKLIVPFPFGTIVKLSNGDIGIVQETPVNYPLRPTVKIVKSLNHESEGNFINLIDELSLVISGIEYNL